MQLAGYEVTYYEGFFTASARPSGKLSLTYTGRSGPVHIIGQERGTKRLEQSKLRSIRRELIAQSLVFNAQEVVRGKQKTTELREATAKNGVTVLVEQVGLEGKKSTLKVRCDQAIFKAGSKPKTGRVEFSGNARVWAYGMGFLEDGEIQTAGGWVDFGDPDDLENKPVTFQLEGGKASASVKNAEENKKG